MFICAVDCDRATFFCIKGSLRILFIEPCHPPSPRMENYISVLSSFHFVRNFMNCQYILRIWYSNNINRIHQQVRLGKNGVEEVLGLGPMTDFEKQGLEALKPELKSSIEKGIAFVHGNWEVAGQTYQILTQFCWCCILYCFARF